MTHVLTEVLLENPFQRISETISVISSCNRIKALDHSRVIFLLNGACMVSVEGGEPVLMQAGDTVILPPWAVLSQEKTGDKDDSRIHSFSLFCKDISSDDPFALFMGQFVRTFHFLPHSQNYEVRSLISSIRDESQNDLPGASFKINALARTLMVEVARQINFEMSQEEGERRSPARSRSYIINQAKEYIGKNHRQSMRLADIAWHLNLSEEHLCRLFKAETGMTIFHFLNWYRIEHAKEALLQSNRSVAKIAEMVGFSSAPLFSRQFKVHTGMSPVEYRMTHGGRFGLVHKFGSKA